MAESVSSGTRDRILQVAADEVRRNPVSAVSMEHVAERAGVTKSSLYKAYGNKYELFADASRVVLAEQIAGVAEETSDHDDALGALHAVLVAMFQTGRDQPFAVAYLYGIFPLLYHGHVGDDVAERVEDVVGEARGRLRERIQAAIEAGHLVDNVDQLTELCLLGSFGYVGSSIHDERLIDPEDFADYTMAALRSVS